MTPAEFKVLFPQFVAEDEDRIQVFLDLAVPYFNEDRWGAFYTEGLANLVAHSIVTANAEQAAFAAAPNQLQAGDVSSKSVGSVSVGRDGTLLNKQAADPFLRTTYGQRYAYLRRKAGMGGIAV